MATDVQNIAQVFKAQKEYFASGATRSYGFRKQQLKKLKKAIKSFEERILEALYDDLGKPEFEAYGSEVGFVYNELNHTLRFLREWMDPERVPTSIVHFPTSSRIHPFPKGQVLILSPWNYPFMLMISPLQAALAAGNTVVLKLPSQVPSVSKVIDQMISETFSPEYVSCIQIKDVQVIPNLITGRLRFDHIFFTGSTRVGYLIMAAAAEKLIPVTLELGGKTPTIVDNTANLKVAAKRIIWGKAYNAGQTCVAPDHVLVHHEVKVQLLRLLQIEADDFMKAYGGLDGFSRMVDLNHFEKMLRLLKGHEGIHGGALDVDDLKLGLCIVDEPDMDSSMMKEEIFGPILPVIAYKDEEDLLDKLGQNPDPLSFYLFSSDRRFEKRLIEQIPFGGGCINNCLIHLSNPHIPFGGIGTSGMGAYHGKIGFDTFTHKKSIMKTRTFIDIPMRYPPYDNWKMKVLRLIFK